MKWPRTLRARLLLSHLVVTLAAVGPVAVFAGRTLADARIAEAEHAAEDVGFVFSNDLEEPLKHYLEDEPGGENEAGETVRGVLDRSASRSHLELVVVTADGRVFLAPGVAGEFQGDPREAAEVQAAFAGEDSHDIRRDETGREMFYAAVPIEHEGEIYGVLQLATPMAPVREAIARRLAALTAVILGVASFVGTVAWLLAENVARPVARLTAAAGRMAEGRLDERVSIGGPAELRGLAAAFNHMAERLSRIIEEQRAFVANASHELRTPLTSVKLRAEALQAGALRDPEVGPRFVAEIEGEVDRLGKMVNDLLDLSRIESGLELANPAPVDLAQLAGEARDAFSVRADRGGVTLAVEVEGTPPPVAGDETHLRRLIDNLLDNAIKHTPRGGSVKCRVSSVMSSVSPHPPLVTLTVSDTGAGVPATDLPHIFERFYRGDSTRPRNGERRGGSGLGLSIAQSIVRAHGGEVSAESAPGRGTTIRVTLPGIRKLYN